MDNMKQLRYDRDDAMTVAVMDDDWDAVRRYCRKYKVPLPKDESVMKAGIYKAVQEIIDIPEEVKLLAAKKCVALGFKPYMGGQYE